MIQIWAVVANLLVLVISGRCLVIGGGHIPPIYTYWPPHGIEIYENLLQRAFPGLNWFAISHVPYPLWNPRGWIKSELHSNDDCVFISVSNLKHPFSSNLSLDIICTDRVLFPLSFVSSFPLIDPNQSAFDQINLLAHVCFSSLMDWCSSDVPARAAHLSNCGKVQWWRAMAQARSASTRRWRGFCTRKSTPTPAGFTPWTLLLFQGWWVRSLTSHSHIIILIHKHLQRNKNVAFFVVFFFLFCVLASVCCWGFSGQGLAPVNDSREQQRWGNVQSVIGQCTKKKKKLLVYISWLSLCLFLLRLRICTMSVWQTHRFVAPSSVMAMVTHLQWQAMTWVR